MTLKQLKLIQTAHKAVKHLPNLTLSFDFDNKGNPKGLIFVHYDAGYKDAFPDREMKSFQNIEELIEYYKHNKI